MARPGHGLRVTGFRVHDVRFPTSLTGDGSDAVNTDCDYSAAYVVLGTNSELRGWGMTFTLGRGNVRRRRSRPC